MPFVPVVVRRSRALMVPMRREMIAKVPDRMRERALLRKQQQKSTQDTQRGSRGHRRSGRYCGKPYWATASIKR